MPLGQDLQVFHDIALFGVPVLEVLPQRAHDCGQKVNLGVEALGEKGLRSRRGGGGDGVCLSGS